MDKFLVIDLDGTLCEQTAGGDEYWTAAPKQDVIDRLKQYATGGWHITIFTARGMKTYGTKGKAREALGDKTRKWLKEHSVPYHRLVFGKPRAERYVDDKALSPAEFVKCEDV